MVEPILMVSNMIIDGLDPTNLLLDWCSSSSSNLTLLIRSLELLTDNLFSSVDPLRLPQCLLEIC
jgi:hypothetical protein